MALRLPLLNYFCALPPVPYAVGNEHEPLHIHVWREKFAKSIGINYSLLGNYINGLKKPSEESERLILNQIHKLGQELSTATF